MVFLTNSTNILSKNPLNFVSNFSGISAELIDELQDTLNGISLDDKARIEINELTGTLKSNFDKVVHHGRRADAIVKNMLQHSREGTGEHRMIDINGLVEEASISHGTERGPRRRVLRSSSSNHSIHWPARQTFSRRTLGGLF